MACVFSHECGGCSPWRHVSPARPGQYISRVRPMQSLRCGQDGRAASLPAGRLELAAARACKPLTWLAMKLSSGALSPRWPCAQTICGMPVNHTLWLEDRH